MATIFSLEKYIELQEVERVAILPTSSITFRYASVLRFILQDIPWDKWSVLAFSLPLVW